MSLRTSRQFGSRGPSQTEEPNKKYIFVFEGEKTEKQYFEGLFNFRDELNIKDLIDIRTLEREDGSRSNQGQVVQSLHESLQAVFNIKENRDEVLDRISGILEDLEVSNSEELESIITEILDGNDIEENLKYLTELIEELGIKSLQLTDFIHSLEGLKGLLDYDKEIDTVCIIIDRDWQSFKEDQYETVLQICNDNNYKLGITNPCIEFWLLLHINDCTRYDMERVKLNKRISKSKSSRKYVESLLAKEISYKKNKLNFEVFKPGIREAIEREKLYCENPTLLKDNVGSSIGTIIQSLLN